MSNVNIYSSMLILNSQRVVLWLLVIIFPLIHTFHIMLLWTKLINFILNSHFGCFLLLLFSLHLVKSRQLHLTNLFLSFSLAQPLFVTLGVGRIKVCCFVLDVLLSFLIISQLSYLVGFIKFPVLEPVFHVFNPGVVIIFFLFGKLEELLPDFSFLLGNEFLLQSLFCVLRSYPLLEVWCMSICVSASCRWFPLSIRIEERNVGTTGANFTLFW